MERSETIGKLALALSKAQGQMESAKKDAENPYFKSRYADLASVVEAIKKPLADNELAYSQLVSTDEQGMVVVETILMHSSGEWIGNKLAMRPTPTKQGEPVTPQVVGSAISYERRYGLQAIAGVPSDDDDGNAASTHPAVSERARGQELPGTPPRPVPTPQPPASRPQQPPPASTPKPMQPPPPRAIAIAKGWEPGESDGATVAAYQRAVRDIVTIGWGNEQVPPAGATGLAKALQEKGVSEKARHAAYKMLAGADVETGKDLTRVQVLVMWEHLETWLPDWMKSLEREKEKKDDSGIPF